MSVVELMIGSGLAAIGALLLDLSVSRDAGMPTIEMVGLITVAVLAGYLIYRAIRRIPHVELTRRIPPDPKDWTGKSFDASGIALKIAVVRSNYLPEKPVPQSHFHRGLLAFAREAV